MAKINKKEYEILKSLGDEWKWIARDKNGYVYIHDSKPHKFHLPFCGGWEGDSWMDINGDFSFIQWEDESPYNIQELIDEYEKEYHIKNVKLDASELAGNASDYKHFYKRVGESEETEVKNIKWLREQIKNEMNGWSGGNPDYFRGAEDAYEDVKDWLNQLDEPEVLSQEWIDEHIDYADVRGGTQAFINVSDLQNLLVPKQPFGNSEELPVIPKFVAEWIEETKPYKSLRVAFEYIAQRKRDNHDDKLAFWVEEGNSETFARAWLDGYTVEEEQKYYVINNDQRVMLVRMMDGKTITEADPFKLEDMYEVEKKSHRLTEKEIKDYDERYMAFAVKVEELEE